VASELIYELIVIVAILVVISIAVFWFTARHLRRRKAELLGEIRNSPRLNSDRAFNRLEMARREAMILARTGQDVKSAQSQIARAQAAFDLGHTAEAYELAQAAHETLVSVRHGTNPLPSAGSTADETPLARPTARPPPSNGGARPSGSAVGVAPGPTGGLPKNRMESQFEMRLLDSDLATARETRPSDPATLAAVDFQTKAHTAFDGGRYSEAFSFALKGRRGLGGNVGAVGPTPGVKPTTSDAGPVDLDRAVEQAASATRCPECGYPTTPDDSFCRGCGTPRAPTTCPQCGAPRVPADTFCGRCGARFS
jgi:hypothetical protein